MLILLRSDFRLPAREAFVALMSHAHVSTKTIFEVPVLEAPQPNAIILRLRKMQPERGAVLVMGTAKDESLAYSLRVLDDVRKGVPYLAIYPSVLLARKSEWREYEEVRRTRTIECFEVPDFNVLVLEQRESYSDLTHRMTLAHLLPKRLEKSSEGTLREGEQTTQEFRIGDRPTGSLPRITDEMLAQAGVEGSIQPESEDRITDLPPPMHPSMDPKTK